MNFETLACGRLEDLADQIAYLHEQGDLRSAALLRAEGLELAQALDAEEDFFYVDDTFRLKAQLQGQFGN
jgi:hypothetical protein